MTFTTNKDLETPARGTYSNTWDVPLNGDMTMIDYAIGGKQIYNATGGSKALTTYDHTTKVLTDYSYIPLHISIENTLNANVIYTVPAGVGGQWILKNITTDGSGGPYTVTWASAGGGASVVIPRNTSVVVYSDGVNITQTNSVSSTNSVNTAAIQDGAVTYPKMNSTALATIAEYRAGIIQATFTGSIVGNTLTATGITGTIVVGMTISGSSVTAGTTITASSGGGVYTVSASQNKSGPMTGDTTSKLLTTATAWSSGAYVALTDGATVTPDFALGYNFSLTVTATRTLANPINMKVGQSGLIVITNSSSGVSPIGTYGSYYKFPGGVAPILETTGGSISVLSYAVLSSTSILITGFSGVR